MRGIVNLLRNFRKRTHLTYPGDHFCPFRKASLYDEVEIHGNTIHVSKPVGEQRL